MYVYIYLRLLEYVIFILNYNRIMINNRGSWVFGFVRKERLGYSFLDFLKWRGLEFIFLGEVGMLRW